MSETPNLHRINIVLSQPIPHGEFSLLLSWLLHLQDKVVFYLPFERVRNSFILQALLYAGFRVRLICMPEPGLYEDFIKENRTSGRKAASIGYHFIVRNKREDDYGRLLAGKLSSGHIRIVPVYDRNLRFFKEKITLHEKDLRELESETEIIRIRQTINTFHFGKLTLLPDKNVYANINCAPLGDMRQPLEELIRKEIRSKNAWRKIRDFGPCTRCLFRWLCPPPSDYDFALGNRQLCMRKEDPGSLPASHALPADMPDRSHQQE